MVGCRSPVEDRSSRPQDPFTEALLQHATSRASLDFYLIGRCFDQLQRSTRRGGERDEGANDEMRHLNGVNQKQATEGADRKGMQRKKTRLMFVQMAFVSSGWRIGWTLAIAFID